MADTVVSEPAPAKINLFLRVLSRRADGFHEIDTIVQPITLADGVRAEPGEGISLRIAGERGGDVPPGDENLVLLAARALRDACRADAGARLLLVKRIPVAAGLGGGSADAAATLRALSDLWGCGLTREQLAEIGARVGSDVPALVLGGAVRVEGRGERVERVELPRTWWALVPGSGIGSGEAYEAWDEHGGVSGSDSAPLVQALRSGDLDAVAESLQNDLEAPVARRHPAVAHAREVLLEAGAIGTIMCGSGPTVAGLARDGAHAEQIASAVEGIAAAALGA